MSFWQKLKKPIFALAPMANVTDAAFRRIISKYGKPDVFWTEFVSVEGLLSEGRERLLPDLWFTKDEHPIVAQIFGSKPEQFEIVAAQLAEMGFDGIDINMGCPDRSIEKSGGGAALIKDPKLAREIIRATKRGAGGLPVSVKTRIGYNKNEIATWIPELLAEDLAVLTVHLRTRKEMSDVPARWNLMPEIVALRDKNAPQTLILGNGDVQNLTDARVRVAETGADGVMIGRGIFGNPWLFAEREPSVSEKLKVMVEHTQLFEELYLSFPRKRESSGLDYRIKSDNDKPLKNFDVMKKHYKAYVNGFDGAKDLRVKLMEAKNAGEIKEMIESFNGSR